MGAKWIGVLSLVRRRRWAAPSLCVCYLRGPRRKARGAAGPAPMALPCHACTHAVRCTWLPAPLGAPACSPHPPPNTLSISSAVSAAGVPHHRLLQALEVGATQVAPPHRGCGQLSPLRRRLRRRGRMLAGVTPAVGRAGGCWLRRRLRWLRWRLRWLHGCSTRPSSVSRALPVPPWSRPRRALPSPALPAPHSTLLVGWPSVGRPRMRALLALPAHQA